MRLPAVKSHIIPVSLTDWCIMIFLKKKKNVWQVDLYEYVLGGMPHSALKAVIHCNMLVFQDLSSFVTKSVKEIEHVMNVGNQNRSVG